VEAVRSRYDNNNLFTSGTIQWGCLVYLVGTYNLHFGGLGVRGMKDVSTAMKIVYYLAGFSFVFCMLLIGYGVGKSI
jgi:hypothetical protein